MAIDIQKELQGNRAFQEEALREDRTQDGQLAVEDFEPVYGKTVSQDHFAEVEKSVLSGDEEGFRRLLNEMKESRNTRINALLMPTLEGLKKYGARVRGDQVDFSHVPKKKADQAKSAFAENLVQVYESEFTVENHDEFLAEGAGRCFDRLVDKENFSLSGLSAFLFDSQVRYGWLYQAHLELEQAGYAGEEVHEYYQTEPITRLEGKYGVDIRTPDYEFKPEDIEVLDRVFGKMQSLRPADFDAIPSITFERGKTRGGAVTDRNKGGKINVHGGFQPPDPDLSTHPSYSKDQDEMKLFSTADTETYLTHILTHEMGHVNEPCVDKNNIYYYRDLFGDNFKYDEVYAEDYRIFLLSGGKEVMRTFANGDTVPFYEERFRFVQERVKIGG